MKPIEKECYALLQAVVCGRDIFCRGPGCANLAGAAHHLFGRKNLSTAFDPRWAVGICLECHSWCHGQPEEESAYFRRQLGAEEYDKGEALSKGVVKNLDYEEIRKGLKVDLLKYQIRGDVK